MGGELSRACPRAQAGAAQSMSAGMMLVFDELDAGSAAGRRAARAAARGAGPGGIRSSACTHLRRSPRTRTATSASRSAAGARRTGVEGAVAATSASESRHGRGRSRRDAAHEYARELIATRGIDSAVRA